MADLVPGRAEARRRLLPRLIDPLGRKPVTLTGSANFSSASVSDNDNDENMVLIRGSTRVADIYFSEFMRVFAHHRFRESVKGHIDDFGPAAFSTWKPQDLFEDWKKWVPGHFEPGSEKAIRRRYFAATQQRFAAKLTP